MHKTIWSVIKKNYKAARAEIRNMEKDKKLFPHKKSNEIDKCRKCENSVKDDKCTGFKPE